MNKPSYTPGPLVAVGPYSNGATVSFDLRREGKEIGYVATVSRVMPNDYRNDFAADKIAQEELEANAKAFAAAPEMAEALLAIKELLSKESPYTVRRADGGGIDFPESMRIGNIFERADAALQKAGLL